MAFEKQPLTYDNLLAGEVYTVEAIPLAASLQVKRGQLLECVVTTGAPATEFTMPSKAATVGNIYRIAAEDADTSDGAGTVIAYGAGYYNINAVIVEGDAATNQMALRASGIILKECQSSTAPTN